MKAGTFLKPTLLILFAANLGSFLGCGGGTVASPPPPPPPLSVSVSPSGASVQRGSSQRFTAMVSPATVNQAVTWTVSGTGCAAAACGTIDATGNYTAPTTVPNPPTVVVTATSVADSTRAAAATVTVLSTLPSFSLSPTSLAFGDQTVNASSQPGFVTLTNTSATAVSIDSVAINGMNYTDFAQSNNCPAVITAGANCTFSVTFTPTSTGDRLGILVINDETNLVNLTGTGTPGTPNSGDGKLSGTYAFLFTGYNSAGPLSVVGSFTADGSGKLIVGNTDVTVAGVTKPNQGLRDSTYSIGSNNLGSLTLNTALDVQAGGLSFTFSLALASFTPSGDVATGGRLLESDSSDQTGTGYFVRQDPAAFSIAGIDGGYAFGLAGPSGINENVALGRFTASGGSLSSGHIDLVGFGASGFQSDQPFAGTYSVDGNGRGVATLNIPGQNPISMIVYVVSSAQLLWMDSGGSAATGTGLQQSGGPFTAASLSGASVFGAAGFTLGGNDVAVGVAQFDGNGNVSGTNDENYFGTSFSNEPIVATYTLDPIGLGRGVINDNLGPGLSNFYLVSPGKGFILSGNNSLEFGTFEPQTGGPFNNASLSGNYALGTLSLLSNSGTSFVSGILSADGAGNFSGTSATTAGTQSFTGTYSVAANGRATLTVKPPFGASSDLVFYFVSPSKTVGVPTELFGPPSAAVIVIEK